MLYSFIDTNIFLSLYAFTDDNIEELNKIVELIASKQLKVIMTSVVNQEFFRNRDKKISESLDNLTKFNAAVGIPRFLEHYPEAKGIRENLQAVKEARSSLIKKATNEITELKLAADELFIKIRDASKTHTTAAVEEDTEKRLKLGNPPGKSGSLGDRYNWEILLKEVPDKTDLHLISRDGDFSSPLGPNVPNSYLAMEWKAKKKAKLHVYADLRSFTKQHFPDIKVSTDTAKILAINELGSAGSFSTVHSAIAKLSPIQDVLEENDALKLFKALIENAEVHLIASDQDVKEFYENLITNHWNVLYSSKLYDDVTKYVEDPVPF